METTINTTSQAINRELKAITERSRAASKNQPKKDKTTLISICLLAAIPTLVIVLNYLGFIHSI